VRRAHWLRDNKTTSSPHLAAWFDTETDQVSIGPDEVGHTLRFGWLAMQRTRAEHDWLEPDWHRFTSPESFWDLIEARVRERTRLFLFAHNLGFDAATVKTFSELPRRGWKLSRVVIEGPPTILRWTKPGRSILMLDTLNWWRVSLRELGESLGVAKLEMPKPGDSAEDWDVYCRRDVEVIRRAVLAWWHFLLQHDLGGFAPTLAGQALRAFRHRFLKVPLLIDDNARALELARSAYVGGRVECFRIGHVEGPVYHFDVNSMYPYVMKTFEYPTVLRLVARKPSLKSLERWLETFAVVADVEIETDEPIYGLRLDGRLCFPVGRFRVSLCSGDLQEAIAAGRIRHVHLAALYDRAPLFGPFVDTLYTLRQRAQEQGDYVQSWLIKILLNSLYGKFGQAGHVWETVNETASQEVRQWVELDYDTGETKSKRSFSGVVQELQTESESRESSPAIAAHVTSYARLTLWRLIQAAGTGEVFYVDTDSLFVGRAGAQRLSTFANETGLGGLKSCGEYAWIEVRAPKDYSTPETSTHKGIRAKALWLSPDRVRQEQWTSLVGMLRRGDLGLPTTRMVEKTLARVYLKGVVGPGGVVSPFRLGD
jgi:hypothetical protein